MKRRGEVTTTLIMLILIACGIGAAYYVYAPGTKMPSSLRSSQDHKQVQEADKWKALVDEIHAELSSTFGGYYPDALESFDYVPNDKAAWGDKRVYDVRDKALMRPEDFVKKFAAMTKSGSLEVADDGKDFSIDLIDGESFDLSKTLDSILIRVDDLRAGTRTMYVDPSSIITKSVTDKNVDGYGYVRLVFKTNIDDVYVLAVFNIDPAEVNHYKGRYIAAGKDIMIEKSQDIMDRIEAQTDFDSDFYILKFSLDSSEPLNDDVNACLEKFIAQFK